MVEPNKPTGLIFGSASTTRPRTNFNELTPENGVIVKNNSKIPAATIVNQTLPVTEDFPDPLKTPEVPIEPSRIQIQFEEIEFGEHGVVGDVMKTLKSQEAMLTALLLAYIYDIVTNVAALAGNQVDVVDVVLGIFVGFSEYFLHGINHFYERTSNERMNEKRFLMATKVILLAMIVADFAFSIKPITDHYSQETDSTVQIGIGITAIVVSALTTVAQMKLPEQIAIVRSAQNYKRRKL